MSTQSSCLHNRRRLLLGGAIAALSASFATPVFAQALPQATVQAGGTTVLATDQSQANTAITAAATDPLVDINGPATGSNITVSSNSFSTTAQANRASASLAPNALTSSSTLQATSLQAGYSGTVASAPTLIATRQSGDAVSVASSVGLGIDPRIGAVLGDVSGTSATVANNTIEAVALANAASGSLAQSGVTGSGAGLVSDQLATGNSTVSADTTGVVRLKANSLLGSDFTLTGNLERAIGYGNSAANALTSDTASLDAMSGSATPSVVGAYTADPAVNAGLAILADQRLAGSVEATNTGGFNMRIYGPASASSLNNSSNALIAAGYGNQSANQLSLTAPALGGSSASGGIADVTNVQQVAATPDSATALYGPRIIIDGSATNINAAATNNSGTALAVGNQADGNLLSVSAGSIDTGAGGGAGGGGGSGGGSGGAGIPIANYVGTAVAADNGAMSVTAPFSVQNNQLNQGAITASAQYPMLWMTVGGALANSSLTASGNSDRVGSTGNSATNGLTLAGANVATAADLNSFQAGQGTIKASIGSPTDLGGAVIQVAGGVTGSSLSVTGNSLSANATEDNATNSLGVSGSALTNGSGHTNAQAGTTVAGLGAAADYALANNQQIKGGYQLPVGVSSEVDGAFGVISATGLAGSSVYVTNNSQSSSALGNIASNSLSLTAASLGGTATAAPGSALSSYQSGQTDVTAMSNMELGAPFASGGSAVIISGNSNLATAGMNAAINTLTVNAPAIAALSGAPVSVTGDMGSVGTATGDHVLANNQIAGGAVVATVITTPAFNGVGTLNGASASVNTNTTQAVATANLATNSLTLAAATAPAASAGLGTFQQNDGGVTANASTTFAGNGSLIQGSQTTFVGNDTAAQASGNSATNAMTLSGAASESNQPGLAEITTGPLNSASGPAVLSNVQMNAGAILASSTSTAAGMSAGGGSLTGSALGFTGNSVTAAAYGNNATNQIALTSSTSLPAAGIANTQMNSGPVTAQVVSASFMVVPGSTSGSRLAITGNAMTAQAVGNLAISTVTATR